LNKTFSRKNIVTRNPVAYANLRGSSSYSDIKGIVEFYNATNGVLVATEIEGLPQNNNSVFGFHIHDGLSCTDNGGEAFSDAGMHYNPDKSNHPNHAGDMPPLFSMDGNAFMTFITNRFKLDEIVGKTVVIHSLPDDFTTQPAGNSGERIACGVIEPFLYDIRLPSESEILPD